MLHSLKEENERKTKETGEKEQKQRTKDFLGGWEQQLRGDCARLCARSELANYSERTIHYKRLRVECGGNAVFLVADEGS